MTKDGFDTTAEHLGLPAGFRQVFLVKGQGASNTPVTLLLEYAGLVCCFSLSNFLL